MIIRTTSKQHTGGAMEKKDQPEWMTDGQSVVSFSNSLKTKSDRECARLVSVLVKCRCASGCAVRFGPVRADVRSFGPYLGAWLNTTNGCRS
jgi:hypothetical protein